MIKALQGKLKSLETTDIRCTHKPYVYLLLFDVQIGSDFIEHMFRQLPSNHIAFEKGCALRPNSHQCLAHSGCDNPRAHFCGSSVLPLEVVDEILYQVVQIGGHTLEAAVRACANIVPLDLGPQHAQLLITPEPLSSPPKANSSAIGSSRNSNSTSRNESSSKDNHVPKLNGSALAIPAGSARERSDSEQRHTELDLESDEAYSNPLHRKIRYCVVTEMRVELSVTPDRHKDEARSRCAYALVCCVLSANAAVPDSRAAYCAEVQ